MNTYNKKDEEERKKGFIPFLSRIFGKGSEIGATLGSAGIKAGVGGAKTGFFASLLSTKAGVVGLLLGAATIAAGIGVIYNYLGSSGGKVYTSGLFSNAYYEEAQKQANIERAGGVTDPSASSSLDMFKQSAVKELKAKDEENKSETASQSADIPDVSAPQAPGVSDNNMSDAGGKLNASLGFDSGKTQGGGGSSPRLQTSGGLWSNMNTKFNPVSRNPNLSKSGKASAMNKQLTAKIVASPKYTVPNIINIQFLILIKRVLMERLNMLLIYQNRGLLMLLRQVQETLLKLHSVARRWEMEMLQHQLVAQVLEVQV